MPSTSEDWRRVFGILKSCSTWKAQIRRACERHLQQEALAWDVESYHNAIVDTLTTSGADLHSSFDDGSAPLPRFAVLHVTLVLQRLSNLPSTLSNGMFKFQQNDN